MKANLNIAAVDLGASSGRVMLARFKHGHLTLKEAHRFPNGPVRIHDHLYWNVLQLFEEIKKGLCKANQISPLNSLGVDTWGVDFGLLDDDDQLLSNPFHYRDPHTNGMMDKVFNFVDRAEIFNRTGIQFMQLNSIYQLFAMRSLSSLKNAKTFLLIPDLLNFWLSGRKANEYSIATTTQFFNPHKASYDGDLLAKLGLPTDIFPEIVPPGTTLGPLHRTIVKEIGLPSIPVITPACHDTGSAVAAVPMKYPQAAYISSGTWSLVGVETKAPLITQQSLNYNFTNEGGINGTFRLLKNVTGLWLVQECRRIWSGQGTDYSWEEISRLAEESPAFISLVDPNHPDFLNPSDMPSAIETFCLKTDQPTPSSHGAFMRCIFESLALKYRWVINCLEDMLGHRLETIHIIGGGSQNSLLCQMTADATDKYVIAGPVEATAIGNALVQAISLGNIGSIREGREVVASSFPLKKFFPKATEAWEEANQRFQKIVIKN
jgi:rhamnulokinase